MRHAWEGALKVAEWAAARANQLQRPDVHDALSAVLVVALALVTPSLAAQRLLAYRRQTVVDRFRAGAMIQIFHLVQPLT